MTVRARLSVLATALAVALSGAATPAQAGPVASSVSCDARPTARVFLPWLDVAQYSLLPHGGFEAGAAGWTSEGASVVKDNEPWTVREAGDRRALALEEGGSALSPPVCAGLEHPTLRLFARGQGTLAVSVLATTALGVPVEVPIGTSLRLVDGWAPTLPLPVVANLLPLVPGEYTEVRFRFTALEGDWRIDDVYLDPYSK